MEKYKNLSIAINELCKFLDITYNINNGGCCYVSYLVAKHLHELNIPYSIVFIDDYYIEDLNESDIDNLINKIKEKKHDIFSGVEVCNHYALLIDGIIINDMNYNKYMDINKLDRPFIITDKLNYKDLEWIYRTGNWNEFYDSARNKFISIYINTFFNTFKLGLLA